MPTGPEHYRAAEQLITAADNRGLQHEHRAELLLEAQVSATLAMAAAVAEAAPSSACRKTWAEVLNP